MNRVISIAVSLAIVGLIYWRIDVGELLSVIAGARLGWLVGGLAMVVPTTVGAARRFQRMAPEEAGIGLGEATRLNLAASVLNMALPSKMGDLAKAWFLIQRGRLPGPLALSLVVFDKACDMLALLAWCAFGLILLPRRGRLFSLLMVAVACGLLLGLLMLGSLRFTSALFRLLGNKAENLREGWRATHRYFWSDRKRLMRVAALSVSVWFLHLAQIWMFIVALNAEVPFLESLGLTPLAILAGLLPLTFAGIGTRDAALIFFYRGYFTAPVGAALGLLCTLRYVLPAVAGVPFFRKMAVPGDRRATDF
jgi:uncharacterized protein (TIRG00374 family)